MVQWLRLLASTAGVAGSIPGRELRFCMPRGATKKNKENRHFANLDEMIDSGKDHHH